MNINEVKLISKVIEDKKLPDDITSKYFGEHKDVMEFIENYNKKFDDIPSIEVIQENGFEDFEPTFAKDAIGYYQEKILEDYNRRNMLTNVDKMVSSIEKSKLEDAANIALQINQQYTRQNTTIDYNDYEDSLTKMYDYKYKSLGRMWQLKNYPTLHNYITSFHGGEFHIIVGRPKTGKTYLALSFLMDLYKQGARVGIASAEMGLKQMINRCDMIATGLNPMFFENGYTSKSFMNSIKRKRKEYAKNGGSLHFIGFNIDDDLYTGTVWDLVKDVKEHKLDVLLIDSLYAYHSSSKKYSTWENVVDIIKDAVSITRQHKILTFVTTQFNRQGAKKKKGGSASDVGYSDAFLQYCDSMMGLYCSDDMQQIGTRRVDVLGVREGQLGEVYLDYKFEPDVEIKETPADYEDDEIVDD